MEPESIGGPTVSSGAKTTSLAAANKPDHGQKQSTISTGKPGACLVWLLPPLTPHTAQERTQNPGGQYHYSFALGTPGATIYCR